MIKKCGIILVNGILFTGMASAQLWSESFSSVTPPVLNQDANAEITNEWPKATWVHYGAEINPDFTDGQLYLEVNQWAGDNHDGRTWGAGIALDSSVLGAAGNYRLSVDIGAIQPDAYLGVRVWDADIGSGGTNNYYTIQNLTYAAPFTPVEVRPTGDATTNLLADVVLNGSHRGLRAVDFSYDGTGDVVVQLMAMSKTQTTVRWVRIDEVSIDLATANPDVPSFAAETNTVVPAASEDIPYTNTAFVESVTANPGGEALTYSARWFSGGLSVSNNGTIYGTPTQGGTNTLYISVADADGAYDDAVFTLVVTNVNDAPSLPAVMDEEDAFANLPYSGDLSSYVSDEEGDTLTFSGSGPAWLHIETNGVFSGTPEDNDYGQNSWEVIVDDGTVSVTGTLNIAVQKLTIPYVDFFDGANVNNQGASFYGSNALVTTTYTNGILYKGGAVSINNGNLRFNCPADGGGYSSASMVLAEDLFADGAGTYSFSLDFILAGNGVSTYIELHDLDLSSGNVKVPNVRWAGVATALNSITPQDGAVAAEITNIVYGAGSLGNRSFDFEYDGSGDVLLRIGAARNNSSWWNNHRVDNLLITGSSRATPYDIWSDGFGLHGSDAASTNDYDIDGWNNLYEFGLGLDPTTNAVAGGAYPEMMNNADGLVFVHAKHSFDDSLVYYLVTDDNLVFAPGWTNTGYTVIGTNVTGEAYNYVTNLIDTAVEQRFIRLIIEQQ